jgi:hypothetical protein
MALAIDKQTENRDLRNTCRDHLTLTMADAKKLESATPLAPTGFEAFLLLLHRFNGFPSPPSDRPATPASKPPEWSRT